MTSEPPQPTEWVITIAVIARPLTAAVTCTVLEVVPALVDFQAAVPRLRPAVR
jgi:hypothetical protein